MHAKLTVVRSLLPLFLLLPSAGQYSGRPVPAQPAAPVQEAMTQEQAQAQVEKVLAAELKAAQDVTHPMRYRLRKSSPRFTSTKEMIETSEGAVARLVSIDDKPLSEEEEQRQQAHLDQLINDPGLQRHRKQSEDADAARALKVLRALPKAFLYQFAGTAPAAGGTVEKYTFKPNPEFTPPDIETQVLTGMAGELWVDSAQQHIVRLEGHLQQDVDFGWGILGKLNKGGWVAIEQADVGQHCWRIVRVQMVMSGRVLFKNKTFDTTEEESQFAPVPVNLTLAEAVKMLREPVESAAPTGR